VISLGYLGLPHARASVMVAGCAGRVELPPLQEGNPAGGRRLEEFEQDWCQRQIDIEPIPPM
jgi:hypothetical protein